MSRGQKFQVLLVKFTFQAQSHRAQAQIGSAEQNQLSFPQHHLETTGPTARSGSAALNSRVLVPTSVLSDLTDVMSLPALYETTRPSLRQTDSMFLLTDRKKFM